jgi:hypothetical protein
MTALILVVFVLIWLELTLLFKSHFAVFSAMSFLSLGYAKSPRMCVSNCGDARKFILLCLGKSLIKSFAAIIFLFLMGHRVVNPMQSYLQSIIIEFLLQSCRYVSQWLL